MGSRGLVGTDVTVASLFHSVHQKGMKRDTEGAITDAKKLVLVLRLCCHEACTGQAMLQRSSVHDPKHTGRYFSAANDACLCAATGCQARGM